MNNNKRKTPEAVEPDVCKFFVSFEEYETCLSDELKIRPTSSWWQKAEFSPNDSKAVKAMQVDEQLIWRSLNRRRHVLISGQAGAGKSNLLKRFIAHCNPDKTIFRYRLCAPTGIAAFNVGAETLHRTLGLGLNDRTQLIYSAR